YSHAAVDRATCSARLIESRNVPSIRVSASSRADGAATAAAASSGASAFPFAPPGTDGLTSPVASADGAGVAAVAGASDAVSRETLDPSESANGTASAKPATAP